MNLFYFLILALSISNCTTVGFHDDKVRKSIDFGEEQTLNVCVFYEDTMDKREVATLEKDWAEELALYNIKLQFTSVKKINRFSAFTVDILEDLREYKLSSQCQRLVYMIGRNKEDIIFEIFNIGLLYVLGVKLEIHGIVETYSNTRGVVKSKYIGLLQILFTSPSSTLIHEGYHLMGCPHMLWKDECYKIILEAKKRNRINTREDKIFAVRSTGNKQEFYSSEQVNYFWGSDKEFIADKK